MLQRLHCTALAAAPAKAADVILTGDCISGCQAPNTGHAQPPAAASTRPSALQDARPHRCQRGASAVQSGLTMCPIHSRSIGCGVHASPWPLADVGGASPPAPLPSWMTRKTVERLLLDHSAWSTVRPPGTPAGRV